MKDVMWEGHLSGKIDLDTLSNKNFLYGLGPVEYLSGEILILNGKVFKSEVIGDSSIKVTETVKVKAPFFGYANIEKWQVVAIPDSVMTIFQLEGLLDRITKTRFRPFLFKLMATVDSANIHVVNLPKGTKVKSPQDAHLGQKDFEIRNKPVTLIGFFSTEHKSIFTHHDTYVHIHLLTDDQKQMGHLDRLAIRKGTAKLYLPI
jgi:acetolactate decarboxylase